MALFKSILGEISGKISGTVFGHGRSGSFLRVWKKPVNPNSAAQQSARTTVANLIARWSETLTVAERVAWEMYAKNVAMRNRMGATIYLTGQNHYTRSNAPRIYSGLAIVDVAPTIFNLGELAAVSITCDSTNKVTVAFDDTAEWCDTNGAGMLLQQSRGMNPSVNFFKGPFHHLVSIDGDAITPPTTGEEVSLFWSVANGQKMSVRARLSQADGRLSAPQIVSCIAAIT